MRSYAQIAPTFWTRGSGRKLRGKPNAQLLALYFMTAPSSNLIGLYYLPLTTICHETGLAPEAVREAMPFVVEIAQYDFDQEIAWLPECARYQIGEAMGEKDKRRPAVERELLVFEGHPFREAFDGRYGAAYRLRSVSPTKGHAREQEAPSKGYPPSGMPPSLAPAPDLVPDPVGGPGGAASPPAAPDATDSDDETVVPLDLLDRARRAGVFSDLLGHMPGVLLEQLEDCAREFMSYWTVGAGTGKRRRHWMRRLREHLRKAHENKRLRPPGAIEHSLYGSDDPRANQERKRAREAMEAAYASAPEGATGG